MSATTEIRESQALKRLQTLVDIQYYREMEWLIKANLLDICESFGSLRIEWRRVGKFDL